ncbi:hypothetical protein HR060_14305 [Catenovulum sp. SM1970]|uniref:hypothetical protein n=1 Tax=Marinifaba aquimaris TaxID=2741323 RepID=UPI001571EA7E|nr:hypothetical protein [Marinifaba aquimaris]NTS78028.1 hypothetical protein [Marinifaba aquimaris]
MLLRFFVFICLCILPIQLMAETVRVRGSQSEFDSTHDYYVGLLKLAFEKANKPLTIKFSPYMVQDRALSELKAKRLVDLYWAGTNQAREDELGFVPIPLNKGLLGYRVFTTHKKNIAKLAAIKSVKTLKQHRLCQGQHWPDTDIMLAAGLNVLPNVVYENMFKQAYSGRCLAFPRGINEAFSEVKSRQAVMPDLVVYDKLILKYPFPMYFFTHKENSQLRDTLSIGLNAALTDGSFDQYMKSHPATQHLFPLSQWQDSLILTIDNPFLPETIDTSNNLLWFTLGR